MPYIVTTKQEHLDGWMPLRRRAATTMEEVREAVSEALWENGAEPDSWRIEAQIYAGRIIGPLPDGTVIEVRQASYGEIIVALVTDERSRYHVSITNPEAIDAYNALHAS